MSPVSWDHGINPSYTLEFMELIPPIPGTILGCPQCLGILSIQPGTIPGCPQYPGILRNQTVTTVSWCAFDSGVQVPHQYSAFQGPLYLGLSQDVQSTSQGLLKPKQECIYHGLS